MGPAAYPIPWSAWRDIEVRFGLALIPLVIEPLLSLQEAGLMGFAAPSFISPRPSHHLSDVGFLSVTDGIRIQLQIAPDKPPSMGPTCPISIVIPSFVCQMPIIFFLFNKDWRDYISQIELVRL